MYFFILVPKADAKALADLECSIPFGLFDPDSDLVKSADGQASYSWNEVASRCLAVAGFTPEGVRQSAEAAAKLLGLAAGTSYPLCDLSQANSKDRREASLAAFVARELADRVERLAERITAVHKSLAITRQLHEQTQAAFSQLEKFVLENALRRRTESLNLSASRTLPTVRLRSGESLVQRIPLVSAGLCDFGISIEKIDVEAQGALTVVLSTVEDSVVHARWTIADELLKPGWVRCAMRSALGPVSLTPTVEITWHGDGSLHLAASIRHPDQRFQLRVGETIDERVLAVKCWAYLPDAEAPITTDALLPDDARSRPPMRRLIDGSVLSRVENLSPEAEHSQFMADECAIRVHPLPAGVSVMRIGAAVPANTVYIDAKVCTKNEHATPIEYSLGVSPSASTKSLGPIEREPLPLIQSAWVRLNATEVGEIHLPLQDALASAHDLFLLTRLAEQPGDASWGWATFERIRVTTA